MLGITSKDQVNDLFELIDDTIQSACHTFPLAICVIEMPSQKYVLANETYCSTLRGVTYPRDIIGKTVNEMLGEPNSDAVNALHLAHERGRPTKFQRIRSQNMSVPETYWTGSIMPLYKENGTTLVLSILAEITQAVMAEQSAIERQAELERLLNRAEQENQNSSTLIALAGHELRTPLSTLLLMTQLAQKFLQQNKPAELERTLLGLRTQSAKLTRLINDLQGSAAIETGKLGLELRPLPLFQIADECAEAFSRLHPTHHFNLALPKSDCAALLDAGRFEQVLTNLLSNAVRYSPPGSTIRICAERSADVLSIIVEDQGVGLPADQIDRIFDRYYQLENKRARGGLGLGLYLAKDLMTRMGGTIWAESKGVDLGSRFTLQFARHRGET